MRNSISLRSSKNNKLLLFCLSICLFACTDKVIAQSSSSGSAHDLYNTTTWDDYNYSERSGSTITYHWLFNYDGEFTTMSLTLQFTRGYQYMQDVYKTKKHQGDYYKQFVKNDPFLVDAGVLASTLEEIASSYGYDKANVALSFVQSLPHDAYAGIYCRFSVEALIDRKADCSDKSSLLMAILLYMGYETVQLSFPGHLAVGVMKHGNSSFSEEAYYVYKGFKFYFAETNGTGYKIGNPGWHKGSPAEITPGFIRAGSIGGTHYIHKCEYCNGTGWRHGGEVMCMYCNGRGYDN